VGIFKEENVVDKFDDCIDSLKHFIGDGIGMWDHNPDPLVDEAN
jgi:hypothetical protein